jgi:hypothetical protein
MELSKVGGMMKYLSFSAVIQFQTTQGTNYLTNAILVLNQTINLDVNVRVGQHPFH